MTTPKTFRFSESPRGFWETHIARFNNRYNYDEDLLNSLNFEDLDFLVEQDNYFKANFFDNRGLKAGVVEIWGSGFISAESLSEFSISRMKMTLLDGIEADLLFSLRFRDDFSAYGSVQSGTRIKTREYLEEQISGSIDYSFSFASETVRARNIVNKVTLKDGSTLTERTNSTGNYISNEFMVQGKTLVVSGTWNYDTSFDSLAEFMTGNHTVIGGVHADTFVDFSGSHTYQGAEGNDTVIFSGNRSGWSIERLSNDHVKVTSIGGVSSFPREVNDLRGIERIQFSDKTIALDTAAVGGQAYRVYKAAFNREPDQGGLGYWIAQMDSGMNMVEVAARFIDSNEFRAMYGTSPTDEQYLTKVYQNVLGRDPEPDGYNWWLNEMRTNPDKTRAKVLADFSESAENKAGTAQLVGQGIGYEPWVG
jgi:hypothetical protein